MSEENVSFSAPSLAAGGEEGEGGRSRSSSPDNNELCRSAEILEHSLESLIVSDSSEECTAQTQDFEAGGSAEQLVMGEIPGGVNADIDEEAGEVKEELENKGESKSTKKRRISSRRTRTVKLSTSDVVLCEVAGVQVQIAVMYKSMHT